MPKNQIILDFGTFSLYAELFDSSIVAKFIQHLPYTISLEKWGGELYGSIGIDFGEDSPVSDITAGGIAYTNKGHYVCVFFGQKPAWPVEYIGQIEGDTWKILLEKDSLDSVTIKLKL